ncbi:MAG: DUF3737 family protein [Clostridia bacterium]|nr:DUF3737 family protein [Clostridia bacterium]
MITKQRFGEERALYGSRSVHLIDCSFDGTEDGESALKESSNILVERTYCNLRYPFWHDHGLTIRSCEMTEKCRAPLWYSDAIVVEDTKMHGVKALRECRDVAIRGSDISSPEFGWSVISLRMVDSVAEGEYFLLRAADFSLCRVNFKGKYSFQYVKDGVIEDCVLDTKDALWHAENVTVRNCTVKGEYLAWYSENLTLINCKISGTQPFCYCKNLKLINCEMYEADLAFEKSDVEAEITTPIVSIKNPHAGKITVPSVEELILNEKTDCRIEISS